MRCEHSAFRRECELAAARGDLRRQGVMLNLAVLGAWIGLSFAPIAVVSLFIAPGGGLLAVALAVSSIFAPVVVAGGRAVHDELRKRRLHLYQGEDVDLSTVAAQLRAFLIETRVAR